MKILYFNAFNGISGDMILGSFLDCCISFHHLKGEIEKLGLEGIELEKRAVEKAGIRATKVSIRFKRSTPRRTLSDIEQIINESRLNEVIKEDSIEIFRRLAKAESFVHGISMDKVHFHELGAVDTIADIVGAVSCFNRIEPDAVMCSPINVGAGTIKTEHGVLPVPAPATVELLKGVPVYSSEIKAELCTPTGAAIITFYANEFNQLPELTVDKVGYGAGDRDFEGVPNVLRLMLGVSENDYLHDEIMEVQTNIDDMNPEVWSHIFDKFFEMGALDVNLMDAHMKKNRPGTVLSVLVRRENLQTIIDYILKATSSFGVRYHRTERVKLKREIRTIKTKLGKIEIKVGYLPGGEIKFAPEYNSCRKIAEEKNIPIIEVYQEANRVFQLLLNSDNEI